MDEERDEEALEKKRFYARKYYQKHREKILADKKKYYEEHPEYRERLQARTKERRKRLQEERKLLGPMPRKTGPRKKKTHLVEINGQDVEVIMVTIGKLAQMFGKKVETLRKWEELGRLPIALYRTSGGVRLYPEFQATLLVEAWRKARKEDTGKYHKWETSSFPAEAKEIWNEYPYGVDPGAI